ncbi:cation/H(+) antiporter 15-like [Magnolia sinica]|uniref:cation/H(+) antiporter 15-like n=1 Tax=Magnolia sinica TaxID=86752 RepID=UPI00265B504E|nr:cation/H(+) antiporter 15-like [Magnolia sinica]
MEKEIENRSIVCYTPMIMTNGIWQGENPLNYSLPLFMFQLIIIALTNRALFYILKPLRQPRVVSEIIGGVILGPSVMGKVPHFAEILFPLRSIKMLETTANMGLIFFLFLVGVEMDIEVLKRTKHKALVIAISGMIIPIAIGTSTSFFVRSYVTNDIQNSAFLLFFGVILSVTAFPVLSRILTDLKLFNTNLGRIAMSAALINSIIGWVMFTIAVALARNENSPVASLWAVLSAAAYVFICIFMVRPAIIRVIQQTPDGESFDDLHISMILCGVMVCGLIADVIGIHFIFGSFVFGLVIPNGPLGAALAEKLEDFVSGLMLPLFFTISGLKTNLSYVETEEGLVLMGIILAACIGKAISTLIVAICYGMPLREGFSLGMFMNTKGLLELIVINIERDKQVLDEKAFAIMVITGVLATSIITPVVLMAHRRARTNISYKRRFIDSKLNMELRILACIHTPRNVRTIIKLLEASYATKKSPISIYALHLVELTGRSSDMVTVHNMHKGHRWIENHNMGSSSQIINAFKNYEKKVEGVSVQTLTAISPYSTMHEDICDVALDKCVAFIIIPFHKQQKVDGGMETEHPAFRTINQNVLASAPCSVGILIDRGPGGINRLDYHIAVLFFGGPDDREALSYAMRMVEHPGIHLTVVRLLEGELMTNPCEDESILTVITDNGERQIDDEFINEFRQKKVDDEAVLYTERVVKNVEEMVSVVSGIDNSLDLYIVGRGQGMMTQLTVGLTDWSDCPELGVIGDMLASSDFAATVSVLVVQQYVGEVKEERVETPDSPMLQREQLLDNIQMNDFKVSSVSGAYGSGPAWSSSTVDP